MNEAKANSERNDTIEYTISDGSKWIVGDRIKVSNLEACGNEAQLAKELIGRWGSVAAKPDGEDSAGRARLALQTPEEVVSRACETASLAFGEFRKRGWTLRLPDSDTFERLSAKKDEFTTPA